MKVEKDHILGVAIGLIPIVILFFVFQNGSNKEEELVSSQKSSMPAINKEEKLASNQTSSVLDTSNEEKQDSFKKRSMPAVSDDPNTNMDYIKLVELQIEAVTIDMYRYLGWFPDEKEMLKKASIQAIADLKLIKEYLQRLDLPDQLIELKKSNMAITDMLIQIYDGIELKGDEELKEAFAELNKLYSQYIKKREEIFKEHTSVEELPYYFGPVEERIKFAKDQEDKQSYLNAVELIKERKFDLAYKELLSLKEKYKNTVFESCLRLRMSDCLIMAEGREESDFMPDPEEGINLISGIVDTDKYSPILFEAFYKWRTNTQFFWHGLSNMSNIPNWQYNLKRWQVIQTIRDYLKTNPDDSWANTQYELLLSLPNIGRGGPFGNDNLSHRGSLYLDVKLSDEQ